MKRTHVHSWRLEGHPFGRVVRYRCTSCPAARKEDRGTPDDRIRRMEDVLGIPTAERIPPDASSSNPWESSVLNLDDAEHRARGES